MTFAGGRPFTRGGVTVFSANLTSGAGGIGNETDADLRRAIRGGVRPDGTRLAAVMPAQEYAAFTERDLVDLIAFLRSLPPVDNVITRSPSAPLSGGAYIATVAGCTNCHGANLAGTMRPDGIAAPNISHDGIGSWSLGDFTTALRTGTTPDARTLSNSMPWNTFGKMSDDELRSLYVYLQSKSAHSN